MGPRKRDRGGQNPSVRRGVLPAALLRYHSLKVSGIINCATYSDGRRVANIQIEEIGQALGERNGFIWIGLHEPSAELLKQIQSEFRLHELAIEDAHRAHQRPKLEAYGDTIFIVTRD